MRNFTHRSKHILVALEKKRAQYSSPEFKIVTAAIMES